MIRLLEDYSNDKETFSHVVGALESALDAGEFKDDDLMSKWYEYWEPLEIYNAVMLDKGEKPKKEDILKKVEAMHTFLVNIISKTL